MKRIGLTLTFLCAVSAFTLAGEQFSKETKELAPAPEACHNWSGFYVGGFGAYSYNTVDVDLELTGPGWESFPDARGVIKSRADHDLDNSGGEVGGLIGYNWQYYKCWVFGLEADGGYLWGRQSHDTGIFDPGGGVPPLRVESSFKTHYLTTVGFHVGYAFGNLLPYVTGGLAIGDSDFSQMIVIPPGGFFQGGSKNNTDVGGMVGAGLQYALTDHWSVRGQYEFVDLGTFDFHHDITDPGFFGDSQAKVHEHNFSVAVIFQF
jgi:outer membrane immunogenic protein